MLAAVSAAVHATWQATACVLAHLPYMSWCGTARQSGSLARARYVPHSGPRRSGNGFCSSGGTPLSVDESLLHEYTLFRGEKKPRERYTYVDELGDRPFK